VKKLNPTTRVRLMVTLLCVVVGALALTLGGCHGGSSTATPAGSAASALATSTVAAQAKTDAEKLLAKCFPVNAAGQVQVPTSKTDLVRDVGCEKVPKGSRVKAAACVLSGVANGGQGSDPTSRESAVLAATAACVAKYQVGATPSASPS
jgi:hypothetical protein